MNKFKVVTDSTVDLTKEEILKYGITITNLTSLLEGITYVDTLETQHRKDFVTIVDKAKTLPKSSQPSIGEVVSVYEELTNEGYDVISIHISSGLSGTYESAVQAAEMVEGNVVVIDSKYAARAMAFQVLKACECAERGMTVEETLPLIDEVRENTTLNIAVINLDNLVKGGRINSIAGGLNKLLNIKVNLKLVDGSLQTDTKGRGTKSIVNRYSEIIEAINNSDEEVVSIGITHKGLTDYSAKIIQMLKGKFPETDINVSYACQAISVHTGSHALALQILTK